MAQRVPSPLTSPAHLPVRHFVTHTLPALFFALSLTLRGATRDSLFASLPLAPLLPHLSSCPYRRAACSHMHMYPCRVCSTFVPPESAFCCCCHAS